MAICREYNNGKPKTRSVAKTRKWQKLGSCKNRGVARCDAGPEFIVHDSKLQQGNEGGGTSSVRSGATPPVTVVKIASPSPGSSLNTHLVGCLGLGLGLKIEFSGLRVEG